MTNKRIENGTTVVVVEPKVTKLTKGIFTFLNCDKNIKGKY